MEKKKEYKAPQLRELGSATELTKTYGGWGWHHDRGGHKSGRDRGGDDCFS